MIDMASGKLLCTFCMAEVVEDESSLPQRDARTNLAQFNEQIQPIYDLLQECENIQLSQSLLEPEPSDLKNINRCVVSMKFSRRQWFRLRCHIDYHLF